MLIVKSLETVLKIFRKILATFTFTTSRMMSRISKFCLNMAFNSISCIKSSTHCLFIIRSLVGSKY